VSRHLQRIDLRFEYPVYFTRDVFAATNPVLREALTTTEPARRHRVLAVLDRGAATAWPSLAAEVVRYADAHADALALVAEPLVVDGGEPVKNDPRAVAALHVRLHDLGIDRHSFVLIVGGGAVLDMAGYAAATTHRGVRVVRVPTTVLAQADSGVGVKNGINAFGKKNFVGTFAPPWAVLNDRRFLERLTARDRIAGTAEAVKVAVLLDPTFFTWLAEHADAIAAGEAEPLAVLVERTALLHLDHITRGGDPFELGSARPLDFGHWAAHKLEALTENRLRHGEAVALGMAIDALYSARTGLSDAGTAEAVLALLTRLGFRLWDDALDLPGADGCPRLLEGLREFQEHLGGELTVTLLRGVGRRVEVHEIDPALVLEVIARLRVREPRG
jgi:3-dehydroquinate synthase